MSMPLLSRNGWTLDGLAALPDDGNRYEIIDGELFVTPTPTMRHQMIVSDLFRILDRRYRRAHDRSLATHGHAAARVSRPT